MPNRKLEKSEISEKLNRAFVFPSFRFCATAKIENSDLKILKKKFRDFRYFRGFRVSDLAVSYYSNIKEVVSFEKIILRS